jgi:hypothetical protein
MQQRNAQGLAVKIAVIVKNIGLAIHLAVVKGGAGADVGDGGLVPSRNAHR